MVYVAISEAKTKTSKKLLSNRKHSAVDFPRLNAIGSCIANLASR